MLRSCVSSVADGQVVVRREVLQQLGMGPNGILYGALCPEETVLVLSPIPPKFWDKAYKIIVHTQEVPGSLSKVAKAIAKLDLNTISSWASTESFRGHLCSTSLVVTKKKAKDRGHFAEDISRRLKHILKHTLSELPKFNDDDKFKVEVTSLSVLDEYCKRFKKNSYSRVVVTQHSLWLNKVDGKTNSGKHYRSNRQKTLWSRLLVASKIRNANTCILTPNTEEAVLSVLAIPKSASLSHLDFQLWIKSRKESFEGYWQHALHLLAKQEYSVFVAHNLLIRKSYNPPIEEAEFHFLIDRRMSDHKGFTDKDIEKFWKRKFNMSFKKLTKTNGNRKDNVEVKLLRVTKPHGIGVPCFLATNAKPKDGEGAKAAERFCRILEGYGFKPVNVDFARGAEGLQGQVLDCVKGCHFMVVLHCPERRLAIGNKKYSASDWVMFEEGAMARHGGDIIRCRFENVKQPAYTPGYVEIVIPKSGVNDEIIEKFAKLLDRWTEVKTSKYGIENIKAPKIHDDHLARDLVDYYGGRKNYLRR